MGGSYFFLHFGLQKLVYCVDFELRSTRIVDGLNVDNLIKSEALSRNCIFITNVPHSRKDVPR